MATSRSKRVTGSRRVDHSDLHAIFDDVRDGDTPGRQAEEKRLSAIDWVNNPRARTRGATDQSMLLAHECIAGKRRKQLMGDVLLSLAICFAHQVLRSFVLDSERRCAFVVGQSQSAG